MDLVSVIIPYYKKRNYVKETILSVINQSYEYLEILIIYDDTNLNDLEFIQELSKLDNRIKIIKNNIRWFFSSKLDLIQPNLGPIAIINKNGIKKGIINLW